MKRYAHKPNLVEAVQVLKPYRGLTANFHRNHPVKGPHGIAYFHMVDAIGRNRAFPTDWVVRHFDGRVEILTDIEFQRDYMEHDANPS